MFSHVFSSFLVVVRWNASSSGDVESNHPFFSVCSPSTGCTNQHENSHRNGAMALAMSCCKVQFCLKASARATAPVEGEMRAAPGHPIGETITHGFVSICGNFYEALIYRSTCPDRPRAPAASVEVRAVRLEKRRHDWTPLCHIRSLRHRPPTSTPILLMGGLFVSP